MTVSQQRQLQEFLIETQAKFKTVLRIAELPSHLCLHIAPDMCYVSEEHEYQLEDVSGTEHGIPISIPPEQGIICNRRSPACHVILCKL